jgi:hypothetical protein
MNRMPLYHFATTDLPADTIAPEMDDRNAATALRSDEVFTGEDLSAGGSVDEDTISVIPRGHWVFDSTTRSREKGIAAVDNPAAAESCTIDGWGAWCSGLII